MNFVPSGNGGGGGGQTSPTESEQRVSEQGGLGSRTGIRRNEKRRIFQWAMGARSPFFFLTRNLVRRKQTFQFTPYPKPRSWEPLAVEGRPDVLVRDLCFYWLLVPYP